MIVNLRGTSGSGKSTIVRVLMEKYKLKEPHFATRKQPMSYTLYRDNGPNLFVPGHYQTQCGGCDTLNGMDLIYSMLHAALDAKNDIIYEGLIVASDTKRCISLKERSSLIVIELTTPLEVCLAGIQARRDARGDDRPLSDKNTKAKMGQIATQRKHWRAAGVDFRMLDREQALQATLEAFKWT